MPILRVRLQFARRTGISRASPPQQRRLLQGESSTVSSTSELIVSVDKHVLIHPQFQWQSDLAQRSTRSYSARHADRPDADDGRDAPYYEVALKPSFDAGKEHEPFGHYRRATGSRGNVEGQSRHGQEDPVFHLGTTDARSQVSRLRSQRGSEVYALDTK